MRTKENLYSLRDIIHLHSFEETTIGLEEYLRKNYIPVYDNQVNFMGYITKENENIL